MHCFTCGVIIHPCPKFNGGYLNCRYSQGTEEQSRRRMTIYPRPNPDALSVNYAPGCFQPGWNSSSEFHMMTSSNGDIFRLTQLLALCAGNSLVTGEFPAQGPVTRSSDVFFDLRLNKWLSKQSWSWWFETPSLPLWRHCNANFAFKYSTEPTIARHSLAAVNQLTPMACYFKQCRSTTGDHTLISRHSFRFTVISFTITFMWSLWGISM